MTEIPCIDCITLPICASEVRHRQKGNYLYLFASLEIKCYMIRDYIRGLDSTFVNIDGFADILSKRLKNVEDIKHLVKFFNLKEVKSILLHMGRDE